MSSTDAGCQCFSNIVLLLEVSCCVENLLTNSLPLTTLEDPQLIIAVKSLDLLTLSSLKNLFHGFSLIPRFSVQSETETSCSV